MSSPIRGAKSGREQVAQPHIDHGMTFVYAELQRRLDQKGRGTYASRHEVLGVIDEEHYELTMAVHGSPLHVAAPSPRGIEELPPKYRANFIRNGDTVKQELADLAVACIFAIACIDAGTLAW